jgi:hypothetical protein
MFTHQEIHWIPAEHVPSLAPSRGGVGASTTATLSNSSMMTVHNRAELALHHLIAFHCPMAQSIRVAVSSPLPSLNMCGFMPSSIAPQDSPTLIAVSYTSPVSTHIFTFSRSSIRRVSGTTLCNISSIAFPAELADLHPNVVQSL